MIVKPIKPILKYLFYIFFVSVSGSHDMTARVWDVHTWECLKVLEGHTGTTRTREINKS